MSEYPEHWADEPEADEDELCNCGAIPDNDEIETNVCKSCGGLLV